jgi:hypothetical protein
MHQRTERGFASVAQLLSFLAAGSTMIMPTLRRCGLERARKMEAT